MDCSELHLAFLWILKEEIRKNHARIQGYGAQCVVRERVAIKLRGMSLSLSMWNAKVTMHFLETHAGVR